MDCQIVETATLVPGQCMFTSTGTGPFLDFRREFGLDHEGRIYISVVYAKEIGRMAGLVDPPDEEPNDEVEELRARVAELEELLTEERRALDAIDVLESRDFVRRKKAGRPPTPRKKEAVNGR